MTPANRERARHRVRYEVDAAEWELAERIFNHAWECAEGLEHSEGDWTPAQKWQHLRNLVAGQHREAGRLVVLVVGQIERVWR